jgi:hypothetical protein
MWGRITGKSDAGSNDGRKKRTSDSTRSKRDRDADGRSVVSYPSTRKPSTRSTAPSSIASFATAFDDPSRARATADLYEDPRDERHAVHSREDRPLSYAESTPSTPRRDRSRSRDRDTTPRKRSASGKSKANTDSHDDRKDERMSKGSRSERTRSTRSDRSGSVSYRGDIVESPREPTRSFSGQITTGGFSQFPGQTGAPMMSGALPPPNQQPYGGMSSHVQAQFPGQDPVQYTSSAMPGGRPFGAAADFYNDQGESVRHHRPGHAPSRGGSRSAQSCRGHRLGRGGRLLRGVLECAFIEAIPPLYHARRIRRRRHRAPEATTPIVEAQQTHQGGLDRHARGRSCSWTRHGPQLVQQSAVELLRLLNQSPFHLVHECSLGPCHAHVPSGRKSVEHRHRWQQPHSHLLPGHGRRTPDETTSPRQAREALIWQQRWSLCCRRRGSCSMGPP